LQAEI